jgi:hypothetical protein
MKGRAARQRNARAIRLAFAIVFACTLIGGCYAQTQQRVEHSDAVADAWAEQTLKHMTLDERLGLLVGMLTPLIPSDQRPKDVAFGVGYMAGIPRSAFRPCRRPMRVLVSRTKEASCALTTTPLLFPPGLLWRQPGTLTRLSGPEQ